jgi:hypothetical protein
MSSYSVFIPHVFSNFDKKYVNKVFSKYGRISDIDFVLKQDNKGKEFNAVYIHFDNCDSNFQWMVEAHSGKNGGLKVLHDDPWFWLVLPNTAKKHVPGERKPRINLGKETYISATTPKKNLESEEIPEIQPKKSSKSYVEALSNDSLSNGLAANSLLQEFDEAQMEMNEIDEAQMDEIEALIDEEESNFITIDGRYVESLEQENWCFRVEIAQLRAALINIDQLYQAEVAKVRAFSQK